MKKIITILMTICMILINTVHTGHISALSTDELINKYYKDKTISILGDSISTYQGYSNNALETNSTIGNNLVWFKTPDVITSVNETWWMQSINQNNMRLLVNNSYSASEMLGNGYIRAGQLHDDTGENEGEKPDYVVIFMGTNDINHFSSSQCGEFSEDLIDKLITLNSDGSYTYAKPTTFVESYIIAIHKIKTLYRSEIFCCTALENSESLSKDKIPLVKQYRDTLETICNYFDCQFVDFYTDSSIDLDTMSLYTSDGIHPNETGMDLLTECFNNEMINYARKMENKDLSSNLNDLIEEAELIDLEGYSSSSTDNFNYSLNQAREISKQEYNHTDYYNALYDLNHSIKHLKQSLFPTLKDDSLINTYENKDCINVVEYCSQSSTDLAEYTLDYNNSTIWHTDWNDEKNKILPHYIIYDLNNNYNLTDILFLPRQVGTNGDVFTFNIYISNNLDFTDKLIGTFHIDNNGQTYLDRTMKRMEFNDIYQGRYVKVESTKTGGYTGLNMFTSFAEIRFYGALVTDKTQLESLYNQLSTLNKDDYTDTSWTQFSNVYNLTTDILDDLYVSQETINNHIELLNQVYLQLEENYKGYADVSESDWYYGSVKDAYELGLMSGVGDGTYFKPQIPLSRAMAATILYRFEERENVEYQEIFSDVRNHQWYTDEIMWAYNANVIKGYNSGRFGPDDHVKRQDLAVMIRNYAKSIGIDTSVSSSLEGFTDYKQADLYARSALIWCVENHIMSGSVKGEDTYLNPQKSASRAESAKMFSNLKKLITK